MRYLSLAAKYRPQLFADVIGQSLITSAFSRSSLLDKIAPAYLLSGTRGIGKTTIARIFAKSLNCINAPISEPCNKCESCKKIGLGSHVDVNEIDGASNTGVDDIRAIRDTIGYLPMEGRYKIFIIDEAHMLSKNAFNALLKTLEEPPAKTVFIFATTESHRFPATIISRCQHFIFRHVSEDMLFKHLVDILNKENIAYDSTAIRMIAKRASGSVRDSLSLLDQAISIADDKIDKKNVENALGIAGIEFYDALFSAINEKSCEKVIQLIQSLLNSGIDINFFLHELAGFFKYMFLIHRIGKDLSKSTNSHQDEDRLISQYASCFSETYLHAAWQLILKNQKSISASLEPGAALEMLLINLTLIPQLLPVCNSESVVLNDVEIKCNEYPIENQNTVTDLNVPKSDKKRDWNEFIDYCSSTNKDNYNAIPKDILQQVDAKFNGGVLELHIPSASLSERIMSRESLLMKSLRDYYGEEIKVSFVSPNIYNNTKDSLSECIHKPEMQLCSKILGAKIKDIT